MFLSEQEQQDKAKAHIGTKVKSCQHLYSSLSFFCVSSLITARPRTSPLSKWSLKRQNYVNSSESKKYQFRSTGWWISLNMLQQQDKDFSNFLPGCTPGLAALAGFTKYGLATVLSHTRLFQKHLYVDCIALFPTFSLFFSSPEMLRTWLKMWTTPWWRWSERSFRWTSWRPWRNWRGWERRNATYRISGADSGWRDKGITQHPLGFFTPSKRKKSACSAVTSRTMKLWMLRLRVSLRHPMLARWNVPCWPGGIGSLHHLGLCCLSRNDLGLGQ